jgi:outer membrane protein TolC
MFHLQKLYILILLVFFQISLAQEQITWEVCLKKILKSSPEYNRAELDLKDTRVQKKMFFGNLLPGITLSVNSSRNQQGPREVYLGAESFSQPGSIFNYHSFSLNLSYPIFNWGNSRRKYSTLIHTERSKNAVLVSVKRKIAVDAFQKYSQLLESMEILELYQKEYKSLQRQKELIQNLVNNGLRPPIDLDQIEVELGNLKIKINDQLSFVTTSMNELSILMNEPPEKQFNPVPIPFSIDDSSFINSLNGNYVRSNPEYLQIQYQLGADRIKKSVLRWNLLPEIRISSYYQRGSTLFDDIYQKLDNNWNAAVTVSFSLPVYQNNQNRLKLEQQEIQIRKTEQELFEKRTAIVQDFNRLESQYESNLKKYKVYFTNVGLREKIYRYEEEKYQTGTGEYWDFLQALKSYLATKQSLIQTKYELLKTRFQLETIKGIWDEL